MTGVLALALRRLALSHGIVPSIVPVGQAPDYRTLGTLGTSGTGGTSEGEAIDDHAIEERAALAADSVPACYLDAWARLQCQRPSYVTEEARRQSIEDAGRFLDAWGCEAMEAGWTPGELFDAVTGLVWRLAGERVEAIGADHVRLTDGRTILRTEIRGRS